MYLGVDYYPEYWPISQIDEDLEGIVGLGANIVRIGEFAWHLMEPEEGHFDFSFYDNLMPKFKQHQLKVMFGTPTATFPAWLAKKHPSILAKNKDNTTRVFGGRRLYCYNSKTYLHYAKLITEKLVSHYKQSISIVSWQIDNEFGHEGSDLCYCEQCHVAFQQFLAKKYSHDITKLNEAYGTIFWGQTYNDFNEIPIPTSTITVHNPALQLDWARFRSNSVNSFALELVEVVRKNKGEHQTITHNFPGGFFENKWYDYAEHAQMLDFASYDNYPVWGGLAKPVSPAEIALGHDFMRGLKQENYWIVEQLIGAQGHNVIGYLPRPNQAKMWSLQAFAHGCTNMLYFNWKAMTKGAEQFCMGIVDHDNVRGRKYSEVKDVFNIAKSYEAVINTEIQSQVALLYDFDNIWSWRIQEQSESFDFKTHLLSLYEPFYRLNVNVDVIPTSRKLDSYKVIVLPAQQIVTKQLAERLDQFVKRGGILVMSYRTGLRDENNNIHYAKVFPVYFDQMAGIVIRGSEALSSGTQIKVKSDHEQASACTVWRDLIEVTSAQIIYEYDDQHFPYAALTKNEYGKGEVYYIGSQFEANVLQKLALKICEKQQLDVVHTPDGLEVVTRQLEGRSYLFILNHTDQPITWKDTTYSAFEAKIVSISY